MFQLNCCFHNTVLMILEGTKGRMVCVGQSISPIQARSLPQNLAVLFIWCHLVYIMNFWQMELKF